ncbi:MAG: hypothetical protein CMM86_08560 [Rhodovulum sp.]|nr:hypothetical protein [Rhodovulum sp.]
MGGLGVIGAEIRQNWPRMILNGVLVAALFQLFMLVALIVRFQALPNYVTGYDWFGNVIHIIRSTPSLSDMGPIIWEEWLLEVGHMNYDYGAGISEWSLNVIPSRLFVLFVLGAMMALCLGLMRGDTCSRTASGSMRAATGLGALLIAMTNATMSWVVCCATPTWVVGLAMLGLGVSSSLALERVGPVFSIFGFALLVAMIFTLAWRRARQTAEPKGALSNA